MVRVWRQSHEPNRIFNAGRRTAALQLNERADLALPPAWPRVLFAR